MKQAFWIWTVVWTAAIVIAFFAIPGWDTEDALLPGLALFAGVTTLAVLAWLAGIAAVGIVKLAASLFSDARRSADRPRQSGVASDKRTAPLIQVLAKPRALAALALLGLLLAASVALGTWLSKGSDGPPFGLYTEVKGGAGPFLVERLRWAFTGEYAQMHRTLLREHAAVVPQELFERCLENGAAPGELKSVEVVAIYDEPIQVADPEASVGTTAWRFEDRAKAVVLRIAVLRAGAEKVRTVERYAIPDAGNGEGRWPLSGAALDAYGRGDCPPTEDVFFGTAAVQLIRPTELLKTSFMRRLRGHYGHWRWAWTTLHPAQQRFVDRELFIDCHAQKRRDGPSEPPPQLRFVESHFEFIRIPGTAVRTRALAVSMKLTSGHRPSSSMSGMTAYAVRLTRGWGGWEGGWRGAWRWLLTQEEAGAYKSGRCPEGT